MKKWYALVGVLVVALGISLGTCSLTEAQLDEFKSDYYDVNEELEAKESELSDVQSQLGGVKSELDGVKSELDGVKSELVQLKATKEINFGNGLRVFGIEKGYYEVRGKVKNVSSEAMKKVVVFVAFYNADGQLDPDWGSVDSAVVSDLFPDETADWKVHFGNWTDEDEGLFDVYAIGSYRSE